MNRPRRTKVSNKNLSILGVPKKFHNLTIEDFEDFEEDALIKVKRFFTDYLSNLCEAFEKNKGILMIGSNGVGKSMLASLLVKEAYVQRYSARRITFSEYINSYTQSWGTKPDYEDNLGLHVKCKISEFLVIEEIGKEIDTKISAPILEDCLRYREDNGLVTIICTNLNMSGIKEKYGDSCYSLLKGNVIPISIESVDQRNYSFKKRGRNV